MSAQTAHTPARYLTEADKAKLSGPYYNACNLNTDMKGTIRTKNGGHLVATLELYGKEAEPVSYLFAAAPGLLAALEAMEDIATRDGWNTPICSPEFGDALRKARAAIAKAKGVQS